MKPPHWPYRSPQGKATKATIALWIMGAAALISIWSAFSEIQLVQNIVNGANISEAQANANDTRQMLISIIYTICFAATGILFLRWEVLAYANLDELASGDTKTTTPWIVLCWLIPVISLYKPCGHMEELWTKSHPDTRRGGQQNAKSAKTSKLIRPWWLTWIAFYFLSLPLKLSAPNESSTPEDLIQWNYISIVSDIFLIAALPMIILLIKQITTNQEIKAGYTRTWQTNAHDHVPLNPKIPVLEATATPATLHAGNSGTITQFSASRNDEPIRLSVGYRHRHPVETPGQLEFWFVIIREDNTLYLDEKIRLNVEVGSTGYDGIGLYIWTPRQHPPQPGRYRAYIYQDDNKIAQAEWDILD